MAAKKTNPEVTINEGPLVDKAKEAVAARTTAAEATTLEKEFSEEMADLAEQTRVAELSKDNYVGLVRVTNAALPPVRIEFRIKGGSLKLEEEANLNALFGAARPILFQREKYVTSILDPNALLNSLEDQGKNPWDYLELKVKPGMDAVVATSEHVVATEDFFPTKEGFLNKLVDIKNSLTAEAKEYIKNYLAAVLSPVVVLGSSNGDKTNA